MELGLPIPSIRGPDFILENRLHVLQIFLPQEMVVDEEQWGLWPSSTWDSESQLFFLSSDPHSDGAAAMASIKASLSVHTAQGNLKAKFNCLVFALGWGRLGDTTPQFTIINPARESNSLNRLDSRLGLYDFRSSSQLREDLYSYGIPQTPHTVYHYEDEGLNIVVSCSCQKIVNLLLCKNPFWRLEVSWKIVFGGEVPGELQIPWR
jgi:hypothetical protein